MVTLKELKGPMICPACTNADVPRVGFLQKVTSEDKAKHIMNHTIDYECQTCFALFEVDNEL